MPIIARHHRFDKTPSRRSDYIPVCVWPDDCTVQWGTNGVASSENRTYRTAFFEAFPAVSGELAKPGFFRGEGKTVENAEQDCLENFRRFLACTHAWSRGFDVKRRSIKTRHGIERPKLNGETHFINGGALCRKCGAFDDVFKPVIDIDEWKRIPSILAFTSAAAGWLRPGPADTREDLERKRRTELRLRAVMGINLPSILAYENKSDTRDSSGSYWRACRSAIVDWYCANRAGLVNDSIGRHVGHVDHVGYTNHVDHVDHASIRKFMSSASVEIMDDMVRVELRARAVDREITKGIGGIGDCAGSSEI